MTIQIDKNLPIPTKAGNRVSKYPWSSLEVGDSFFVAGTTVKTFAGVVANARKTRNLQLVTRTVDEDGVTGVRVWRVG